MEIKSAQQIIDEAKENNEPVFVIRAKDKAAIQAVGTYMLQADALGCHSEFLIGMGKVLGSFIDYKTTNPSKMKVPD